MDTNSGRFVEEEQAEKWMQRIAVGEIIKLKGEECRVVKIGERRVTLELMSADERMMQEFGSQDRLSDLRSELLEKRENDLRSQKRGPFDR